MNNKVSLHPQVRGSGYVVLISLTAWLIAVFGPIFSLTRLVRGLITHITFMLGELGYNILESFVFGFGEIIELIFIMTFDQYNATERISELLGIEGTLSGVGSLVEVILGVSGALISGFTPLVMGLILPAVILIPLIIMLVVLKKSVRASKVLLFVNACLCILGNIVSFTVIKNVSDAMGDVRPPYHNITFITLLIVIIGAVLWVASIVFYFILASKSEKLTGQFAPGPMPGVYMQPQNNQMYPQQPVYSQQQPVYQQQQQPVVYQQQQQPVYQQQPAENGTVICTSCGGQTSGKFCKECGASTSL